MATPKAIATGLSLMHEAFPTRDVTEKTNAVWALLFADVPDAPFVSACTALAVEHGRTFFPTPGEVMALAAPAPRVDIDGILASIHDLGEYGPAGWRYPGIQSIREAMGDSVADAYAEAGGGRCFANADANGLSVTRDIARREFEKALASASKLPTFTLLPPSGPAPKRLSWGKPTASTGFRRLGE